MHGLRRIASGRLLQASGAAAAKARYTAHAHCCTDCVTKGRFRGGACVVGVA